MTFRGLTWDHPRGRHALEAAAANVNSGRDEDLIIWDVQPLEGFESAPIADLASRYDLLVLDHPHIGEACASDCLSPLDQYFSRSQLDRWSAQTVGPAFQSYVWAGQSWALPLDVATQVMALRPDATRPGTWDEVEARAADGGVAQSLAGPHAILTLASMVAGAGGEVGADRFIDAALGAVMLERMHRLYALRPPESETLNPIRLLDRMAQDKSISLIPLIFGYVNYIRPGAAERPVAFADTIRVTKGKGGVLGGTGIAIAKGAMPSAELLDHLCDLMSVDCQTGFIPDHDGQPSARVAWQDQTVNARGGNFYADTLQTAETALLRPRFDGYIAFQTAAAKTLRQALATGEDPKRTLETIETEWLAARNAARGSLTAEG